MILDVHDGEAPSMLGGYAIDVARNLLAKLGDG